MAVIEVRDTDYAQRRELATDARGLPASFARATVALQEQHSCASCGNRAVVVNGAGVGLCAVHQGQREAAIQARQRLRQRIAIERAVGR